MGNAKEIVIETMRARNRSSKNQRIPFLKRRLNIRGTRSCEMRKSIWTSGNMRGASSGSAINNMR